MYLKARVIKVNLRVLISIVMGEGACPQWSRQNN
jgi:hypothetical protein